MLETAQKYGISVSTLQRYLKNVPQSQDISCSIHPIAITLQMDATYWGRNFGVVIFMDASYVVRRELVIIKLVFPISKIKNLQSKPL